MLRVVKAAMPRDSRTLQPYIPRYRHYRIPYNSGALEAAQDMANHSDPRTTKLYDRRKDLATLSEIERCIAFEGEKIVQSCS